VEADEEHVELCSHPRAAFSALAGVRDSEERLHGEQPDAELVGAGSASLLHPAVPAALLREGENADPQCIATRRRSGLATRGGGSRTSDDAAFTTPSRFLARAPVGTLMLITVFITTTTTTKDF